MNGPEIVVVTEAARLLNKLLRDDQAGTWLDSEEFYNLCQAYRYEQGIQRDVVAAFDAMCDAIMANKADI